MYFLTGVLCKHWATFAPLTYVGPFYTKDVRQTFAVLAVGEGSITMDVNIYEDQVARMLHEKYLQQLDTKITVVAPDETLASDVILSLLNGNTLHIPSEDQLSLLLWK